MMWKKNQPSDELIKKIKVEIEFILGRSVELISMRITNTMQYNIGYENKYKKKYSKEVIKISMLIT